MGIKALPMYKAFSAIVANINILAEKAYLSPTACVKYLITSPSNLNLSASNTNFNHLLTLNQEMEQVMLEFWCHSTMVGEHFEYCTCQMPRNA